MTLQNIQEAVQAGARLEPACQAMGLSIRTYQRWLGQPDSDDRRIGPKTAPKNKLSKAEEKAVLSLVNSPEFRDLPPSQIVPRLAERGQFICSEATMYRLLKKAGQLAHRAPSKAPEDRIPTHRVASRSNQVWSWDISYLKTSVRGQFYYLYMVMDIWSRKIVGWTVHAEESGEHAAQLIKKAASDERIDVDALILHSDNGGPMKGATMLATLQELGIAPSFTRPRVSDDNPFSEALFRTLKYRPAYPKKGFDSIESATQWVAAFVRWYNFEHRHSGIKFVRPTDRHDGQDVAILEARNRAYEAAKAKHPERWGSRPTRDWSPPKRVVVRARPNNPTQQEKKTAIAA